MKVFASLVMISLALGTATAHAEDGWRFGLGPSYVSGLGDVMDLYEWNMEQGGLYDEVDVDMLLPIGLALAADYHWRSGLRVDLGLGPVFFMTGDADHFELPVSGTIGFSFLHDSSFSPYVRAGLVYHVVDGDYYRSTDPGLLAAVGIDFARQNFVKFSLEIAVDNSKIEFDSLACLPFRGCGDITVKLNTYDTVFSLYAKF